MKQGHVFIGAYAAYASLQDLTRFSELDFLHALHNKGFVRGLELPFTSDVHKEDPEAFLAALPSDWEYIFTLLPGTMQSLQAQKHYGLASVDGEGRRAALERCERARTRILAWHEKSGKALVRYVHLHSAPTLGPSGVVSSAMALKKSFEYLLQKDWGGAELILEHCDAYRPEQPAIKGFLPLQEELSLAQELALGMTINWGRSALETRSASGALEHIKAVEGAKSLRGVFFSGTAVDDPLYGHWQDNHAPMCLHQGKVWEPKKGLLDLAEVAKVWELLKSSETIYYGLKVQPFPAQLSWLQRLECLEEQIQALRQLWTTPLQVV